MRRALRDALISAGSLVILLLLLVAADDRVRFEVSRVASAQPSVELAGWGYQIRDVSTVIFHAAREQTKSHMPLTTFTVAAAVLVVFMLRT
jgi:hypothetical protein